jgi:hypothetical protein
MNEPGQSAHYVLKSQLHPVWWRQLYRWLRLDFRRPRPDVAIDMGSDTLTVTDLSTNALISTAPLAQVTAKPAIHSRTRSDAADVVYPVLIVDVPGMQPLTIGSLAIGYQDFFDGWNTRFTWRGNVPSLPSESGPPRYVAEYPEPYAAWTTRKGIRRRHPESVGSTHVRLSRVL